ncbi:MAG: hypothetical protein AAF462_03950 [Thermodesulfobacteriota bacterium]
MRALILSMVLVLSVVFINDSFAEVDKDAVSFMFVQSAQGVSFDKENGTMTMKGVAPSMTFFADRPQRAAGHVPTSHFLKIWDEGKDSFAADPPNANLSILGDKEGATNIVVELMDPEFADGNITYKVKVLDGDPPAEGGLAALFIDWWVGPRGAVCRRNWYTGGTWCHFPGPYYRPWGPPY